MSQYILLLGNTPALSLAELQALLTNKEIVQWDQHLAAIDLEDDAQAQQLQLLLSGVYKIFKIIQVLDQDQADEQIAAYLATENERPEFALNGWKKLQNQYSPQSIKKALKQKNISCRYRQSDQWGASSAITEHDEEFIDLMVVEHESQHVLLKTVAAQDVDEWVNRDRNKPYAEGRKGMLPPKLARVMVNIALGHLATDAEISPVLYDPFCGTGTVLIEALLRGCEVVGSDLDHDAVAGSLENLYWLEDEYEQKFSYQVFQADVAHVAQRNWQTKIDLIVTEPFLGKPNPKDKELPNIYKGLTSLYLGAFKAWTEILNPGAVIVIVFPFVDTKNKRYDLQGLIDKLAKYGYTPLVKSIEYYRDRAIVKRELMIFQFQQ